MISDIIIVQLSHYIIGSKVLCTCIYMSKGNYLSTVNYRCTLCFLCSSSANNIESVVAGIEPSVNTTTIIILNLQNNISTLQQLLTDLYENMQNVSVPEKSKWTYCSVGWHIYNIKLKGEVFPCPPSPLIFTKKQFTVLCTTADKISPYARQWQSFFFFF